MYPTEYVFSTTLTPELKEEIQNRTRVRLSEILGIDVDDVMAQYVLVMIGNKKSMGQIAQDLVDFIGDEQAQQFVEWLSKDLPTLEVTQAPTEAAQVASATADDDLEPPSLEGEQMEDTHSTSSQPAKRVVSLKGISATSTPAAAEKKVVSLSGKSGTIRSLSSHTDDMKAIMARRSQRFGVPEPKSTPAQDKTSENNGGRGTKRKANDKESTESNAQGKRPGSGGRLTQLLGPPVNVDQAELDARDSLLASKRKKTGRRDDRSSRSDQENHSDGDGNTGRRQNRRRQEGDKPDRPSRGGSNSAPPLPPGSPSDGRQGRDGGRHGNQPQHGGFRGPPGYGGYPPGPYGHPMFFPPPYGGMPPFGMGYPPHGMPRGPYMPPMPHGPPKYNQGPRGPRPSFQNRKWVNPNAAKSEEGEAGAAGTNAEADAANSNETSTNEGGAAGASLNPRAQTFAPRNPYFSSQMRPRFQNKTWVRQDPAQEQELSASLPQTPPQEQVGEGSAQ